MSVSQAETSAFLNAQNKVTGYLQKFMDASGWFHDAPIPQDVRVDVDGPLKNLYGALAEDLKEALLIWDAKNNPPEASLFFDTLRAFSAGMQAGEEIAQQYRDTMKTIVHGASRIGIGFVPFVGQALDLCEAVTGKEWCLPSGKTLTTGERVFSGIGFGIGKAVKVWKGVSTAAISAEGKAVAAGVVTLGDDVGKLLRAQHLTKWRTLAWTRHWDVGELWTSLSVHERRALQTLMADEGHQVLAPSDKIVRELLDIGSGSITGSSMACEFITVTKNDMLVLSEVKGIGGGKVDIEHALQQLRNVAKALQIKGLVNGMERVQIFVPTGSKNAFNGELTEEAGQLVFKETLKPVTLAGQGRSDLSVQVVYQ